MTVAVPPRLRWSGAGAVLAVAVLQVVAVVVTGASWFLRTVFAGGACAPDCDWAAADAAGVLFVAAVLASVAVTAAAAVLAGRTGRDLAWVPLFSTSLVVAGYLAAAALFDGAMR
ncbi:hypothetical protein [Microbacterium sp. NPDC079995]|uniref:hypothetical protein n=1 Tax=unclassified Microbacterium TaxID=2609290 RepID=UPI003450C25E